MSLLRLPRLPSKIFVVGLLALVGAKADPVSLPSVGSGPDKKVFEEWAFLVLDGKRCGFDSVVTTQADSSAGFCYRTVEQEEFVVKRMGVDLKIMDTSKITEDAEGGVLAFEEITEGAGSNIESSGRREGNDLIVSSRGQTGRYHVPRLAALGPEAVRRLTNAEPLRPAQTFFLPTFESDYPQAPVIEHDTIVGPEPRLVNGVERELWKTTSTTSLMSSLATTSWVDDRNNDVESLVRVPGVGQLDEIVSDRAECMKQPEGAELFSTSLIHPQRAIPSPREQAQAYYRITVPHGREKLILWDEGEQRIISSRPGRIEFVVTVPNVSPADATWQLPHADTPELHPYLQASAYLEVNSPEIQALAREAVGNEKNPVTAAHRIETFVGNYITKKDLKVGFASAEETAKSREGDCTEHAVLCAALGRAVGLPTRCVLGLGYIPPGADEPTIANAVGPQTGIFGFHMWAEAWIGPGQWVAMDAALGGFDVGHIAITKSALEEVNPLADLNMPILQLMENIRIEVLKTVPKAKVSVPSDVD
jgi:hypothetical protein